MVSKRELGVSYLVTVGLVLFGILSAGVLPIPTAVSKSTALLALCMGLMVAGGFTLTGVGLARSTLDGERVWRVAAWSTLGLGIPTLLAVVVRLWFPWLLRGFGWRSVLIVNIAAGGVVGVLAGSLFELQAEHERTRTLNQRNTVFLRLFRHDIRTSVNIVRGHLDLLVSSESPSVAAVEVIDDQLDHIARLSEAASRLDDLGSTSKTTVDLGALVAERIEEVRRAHDDVTVETDLDREAYVRANDLLASVVDNLLRNAVEHNDDDPTVWVTVRTDGPDGDSVELRVRDDGPGFSESELAVHSQAVETALNHSDGVGLWLVRWIVDAHDGTFDVENLPDCGAATTVTLPAANREADHDADSSGVTSLIERR